MCSILEIYCTCHRPTCRLNTQNKILSIFQGVSYAQNQCRVIMVWGVSLNILHRHSKELHYGTFLDTNFGHVQRREVGCVGEKDAEDRAASLDEKRKI